METTYDPTNQKFSVLDHLGNIVGTFNTAREKAQETVQEILEGLGLEVVQVQTEVQEGPEGGKYLCVEARFQDEEYRSRAELARAIEEAFDLPSTALTQQRYMPGSVLNGEEGFWHLYVIGPSMET